MRSTQSASTLSLGGAYSPSPTCPDLHDIEACKMPMVEYVLGSDLELIKAEKETLTTRLAHWIKVRGPSPTPEHVGDFMQLKDAHVIWDLIQSKHRASEDFDKLNVVYQKLTEQVHIAKAKQLEKWKSTTVSKSQVDDLDSWAQNKLNAGLESVKEGEQKLAGIIADLESALLAPINKMLRSLQEEDECDELMCELEQMFGDMEIDEVPKNPEMDAAQIALGHVQALEDGPQKTALMAVLETALTRSEVWFLFVCFVFVGK